MKTFFYLLSFIFIVYGQVNGDVNVLNKDRSSLLIQSMQSSHSLFRHRKLTVRTSLPAIQIKRLMMVHQFGADIHQFRYKTYFPTSEQFEQVHNFNYSLFTSFKLRNAWSINQSLSAFYIASSANTFHFKDIKINGNIFAESPINKQFIFSFGVGYQTLFGKTSIVPTLHLKGHLQKKLSFALGLPNSYIKYDLNWQHTIAIIAAINDFETVSKPNKLVYGSVDIGLKYMFWLNTHWALTTQLSYPVFQTHKISTDHNKVLQDLTLPTCTTLGLGIQFNPFRFFGRS